MEQLLNILPPFDTAIVSYEERKEGFVAVLRLNIETKAEALEWLKQFSELSLSTFRVEKTFPENSQKLVFKKEYHCVHNSKPSSHRVKTPGPRHTSCNAKLTITVKQKNMKLSKDEYLKKFPAEILIRHTHNHPLVADNTWKKEPPIKKKKIEREENVIIEKATVITKNENEVWQETIADINLEIDKFCEDLKKNVCEKPGTFYSTTTDFLTSYKSLNTESSLLLALRTFGKLNEIGESSSVLHSPENIKESFDFEEIAVLKKEYNDDQLFLEKQNRDEQLLNIIKEHSYYSIKEAGTVPEKDESSHMLDFYPRGTISFR